MIIEKFECNFFLIFILQYKYLVKILKPWKIIVRRNFNTKYYFIKLCNLIPSNYLILTQMMLVVVVIGYRQVSNYGLWFFV